MFALILILMALSPWKFAHPVTAARSEPTMPSIVVFRDGVAGAAKTDTLERVFGFVAEHRYGHALQGFAAQLPATALQRLAADPDVTYLSPDYATHLADMVPVASGETVPTGVRRIGAATTSAAHAASNVAVAVLDTGLDLSNPDLDARDGSNCVRKHRPAQDDNGHGTHVAGTIAARNNGTGIVGVAPGTSLYAVKVLDANGIGKLSQLICGIDWVMANAVLFNIKVANMSLTADGASDGNCGKANHDALHKAICGAVAAGTTYVVAAGNNGTDFASFIPAAYPEVLTVAAMMDTDGAPGGQGSSCTPGETDDQVAGFSNWAGSVSAAAHTLAAPGVCISSTHLGGGLTTMSGTSMAVPHVSGTVALCYGSGGSPGACAGLAPAQVIERIRGDAAAAASPTNGFGGDPSTPVTGRYYGYLVTADVY